MENINYGKTRRKNIAKTILIMFLVAIFFITLNNKSFAATAETLKSVIDDGTNYIIYTNDYNNKFEYAFSSDSNSTPTVYYQCQTDTNGNNVVIVPKANKDAAKYLYTTVDGGENTKVFDVSYGDALTSTTADYINSLTTVIAVNTDSKNITTTTNTTTANAKTTTTTVTQQYVEITDTKHTDLQYILVKLDKATAQKLMDSLNQLNVNIADANPNPAKVILLMENFWNIYSKELLPVETDSRWGAIPADKTIYEPLSTQDGDVYLLWLRGNSNETGKTETDMQILTCTAAQNIKTTQVVAKLPKTGADFVLEGLLAFDIILIIGVCVRIRNLKKRI